MCLDTHSSLSEQDRAATSSSPSSASRTSGSPKRSCPSGSSPPPSFQYLLLLKLLQRSLARRASNDYNHKGSLLKRTIINLCEREAIEQTLIVRLMWGWKEKNSSIRYKILFKQRLGTGSLGARSSRKALSSGRLQWRGNNVYQGFQ